MVYAENEGEVFLGRSVTRSQNISEKTQQDVDTEVRRILDEQYAVAYKILSENRDKMETMCKALVEWETIDRDQVLEIMAGKQPSPPKDYSHNVRGNGEVIDGVEFERCPKWTKPSKRQPRRQTWQNRSLKRQIMRRTKPRQPLNKRKPLRHPTTAKSRKTKPNADKRQPENEQSKFQAAFLSIMRRLFGSLKSRPRYHHPQAFIMKKLSLIAAALLLAACSSTPPAQYYQLPDSAFRLPAQSNPAHNIGVKIVLAAPINGDSLLYQSDEHTLTLRKNLWASPLDQALARAWQTSSTHPAA